MVANESTAACPCASQSNETRVCILNWAYGPMIPWGNVTISARARITQANKRLRSLTAGGGRHGMAISRGLVVQNGRCSRRSPSVVLRLGMRPQCTQPQAAYATAKFPLVAHATLHVVGAFSRTAIVFCGTRPAWAIGDRGGSVSPTCSGFSYYLVTVV